MRPHKTFAGTVKAAERAISECEAGILDQAHASQVEAKVDFLARELSALWTDPARNTEAQAVRARLFTAWHRATV